MACAPFFAISLPNAWLNDCGYYLDCAPIFFLFFVYYPEYIRVFLVSRLCGVPENARSDLGCSSPILTRLTSTASATNSAIVPRLALLSRLLAITYSSLTERERSRPIAQRGSGLFHTLAIPLCYTCHGTSLRRSYILFRIFLKNGTLFTHI